eukprot:gene29507-35615_t
MGKFLDLDTLLSEEERVPCVFKLEIPGLGFLDPNNDHSTLPAGARVELPLWMAQVLFRKGMITMDLPKHFDRKMRDNIAAGASNLNLKEYSNYFYEVGMLIANLLNDSDLKNTLRIAFTGDRYRAVMATSLTSAELDTGELAASLTHKEAEIFQAGVQAVEDIQQWRQRNLHLQPSALLGKKRLRS